jgi:hypothetical protein
VQRHKAGDVSGVVDIGDADQFNDGVIRADRRFGMIRRNEVFVTLKAEVGYTAAFSAAVRFVADATARSRR